jgi:hypothetical protein
MILVVKKTMLRPPVSSILGGILPFFRVTKKLHKPCCGADDEGLVGVRGFEPPTTSTPYEWMLPNEKVLALNAWFFLTSESW